MRTGVGSLGGSGKKGIGPYGNARAQRSQSIFHLFNFENGKLVAVVSLGLAGWPRLGLGLGSGQGQNQGQDCGLGFGLRLGLG